MLKTYFCSLCGPVLLNFNTYATHMLGHPFSFLFIVLWNYYFYFRSEIGTVLSTALKLYLYFLWSYLNRWKIDLWNSMYTLLLKWGFTVRKKSSPFFFCSLLLHPVSSLLLSPLSLSLSSLSLMDILLKPALTVLFSVWMSDNTFVCPSETAGSHVCSGFSAEGVLVLNPCGVVL